MDTDQTRTGQVQNVETNLSRTTKWRALFDRRVLANHRWEIIIASAALLSFILKICIALRTYGTNDVLYWENFLATANRDGGIGLYHQISYFNHPPFMIHLLHVLDFLTRITGIGFPFWIRLPGILADLGSVYLVWKILSLDKARNFAPVAVLLMAVAPTSIMVSGFHGNTDPVMIFLVLLSVYLIDSRHWIWLAGLALGMATNIKIVPVIFVPAIFLYLPDLRSRLKYFTAMGMVFLVCSIPYLFQEPVFIIKRVFGYGSIYGQWGFSRLLGSSLPESANWINSAYNQYGKFLVVAIIIGVSIWMNRMSKRPSLFLQLGLVVFVFMTLSPGFGIQYLAWLIPWVVGLGVGATVIYYLASGIFSFLVYNYWAVQFPWFLADSDKVGPWKDYLVYYELLCWAVVVAITLMYFRPGGVLRGDRSPREMIT